MIIRKSPVRAPRRRLPTGGLPPTLGKTKGSKPVDISLDAIRQSAMQAIDSNWQVLCCSIFLSQDALTRLRTLTMDAINDVKALTSGEAIRMHAHQAQLAMRALVMDAMRSHMSA